MKRSVLTHFHGCRETFNISSELAGKLDKFMEDFKEFLVAKEKSPTSTDCQRPKVKTNLFAAKKLDSPGNFIEDLRGNSRIFEKPSIVHNFAESISEKSSK